MIVCFLYCALWMWVLPKWRGYRIRPEILDVSDNGANTHRLTKVPLSELAQWDAEHDDAGNLRRRNVDDGSQSSTKDSGDVAVLGDPGTTLKY